MSRAFLPAMRAAGRGAIVNTCSVVGVGRPRRAGGLLGASKGAVLALTKAMAADEIAHGIRVNCVSPGTVWSPWVERLTPRHARSGARARGAAAASAARADGELRRGRRRGRLPRRRRPPSRPAPTSSLDGGITGVRIVESPADAGRDAARRAGRRPDVRPPLRRPSRRTRSRSSCTPTTRRSTVASPSCSAAGERIDVLATHSKYAPSQTRSGSARSTTSSTDRPSTPLAPRAVELCRFDGALLLPAPPDRRPGAVGARRPGRARCPTPGTSCSASEVVFGFPGRESGLFGTFFELVVGDGGALFDDDRAPHDGHARGRVGRRDALPARRPRARRPPRLALRRRRRGPARRTGRRGGRLARRLGRDPRRRDHPARSSPPLPRRARRGG